LGVRTSLPTRVQRRGWSFQCEAAPAAEKGGGSEQAALPEGEGSSEGSSVTVKRKVRGLARAPSSNVEARGSAGSPEEGPGPKARRRGEEQSDSASEESRRGETPVGRRTLRKRKERKRWSSASLLNWCRGGTDSEGTSAV
ncbi:Hypothetical predicted protein, partial [Podarcis lilfordi]